jgi:hypothetical protein
MSYFIKINFNNIPSTHNLLELFLSCFPTTNLYAFLFLSVCTIWPFHLSSLFNRSNKVLWKAGCNLRSPQYNYIQLPITLSLLCPNIVPSFSFQDFSVYSSSLKLMKWEFFLFTRKTSTTPHKILSIYVVPNSSPPTHTHTRVCVCVWSGS